MNKRIGNISFYDSQGRDTFTKPYSEETARIIDEEVSVLIESQYQRAIQTLTENKEKLTELALKLLTSEVIFKEDLELIFGKRPWDTSEIAHPSEPQIASEELDSINQNSEVDETMNSSENESQNLNTSIELDENESKESPLEGKS